MKKSTIAALGLLAVLSACGKSESGATGAADVAKEMGLPQACSDYFAQVDACVTKIGAGADAFKQMMEQTKAQVGKQDLSDAEKAEMSKSCQQAGEQFKQAAAALGC